MGIEVLGPVFPLSHAWKENPAFFHNQIHHRPFVALKLAQTLDGRIAASEGLRTTITGQEAQRETHRLRAGFQAVMVGSETVAVDDPRLTVREDVPMIRQPVRIVLDSRLRTSPAARLFEDVAEAPILVFTSESASASAVRTLSDAGAEVEAVRSGPGGLAMDAVLASCWRRGLRSLFCEGGARLASTLVLGGHAQRLYLFLAPFVLGSHGVPAFPESGSPEVWSAWSPAAAPMLFGRDALLTMDRRD
jgi:diaminohydroxyphosphoribosylaminopyrimidine deaminase/5-amino-6-(5-phosphoribosylamino)uracil reductase